MNELILNNLEKIHTTPLGKNRLIKNLKIDKNIDIIEYIKNLFHSNNCKIYKKGKNFYAEINDLIITINSFSFTIITAHKK